MGAIPYCMTRISVKVREEETEAPLNDGLKRLTRASLMEGYTVRTQTINEICDNKIVPLIVTVAILAIVLTLVIRSFAGAR